MRNSYLYIAFGVISLVVMGAGDSRAQATQLPVHDELHPKSTSPYEIARVVNQSRRIWDRNHIQVHVDLSIAWNKFGIESEYFPSCAGDCDAKIFRHELDSSPGQEVVLKLTHSLDSCRYLIFSRARRHQAGRFHWRFVGHIDHDFNRYEMSRHRVLRAFGKNWLVVRGQEGSGSGYSLYGETWYEVGRRAVSPVLHYWTEGRTNPHLSGLSWLFKSRPVVLRRPHNGQPTIALRVVAEYTVNDVAIDKFADRYVNQRLASYRWKKGSRTFVFDRHNSSISEMEMAVIANVPTDPEDADQGTTIGGSVFFSELKGFVGSGFEMFLTLNVNRLKRIALGKDAHRREWLSEFLKYCNDTPEKLMLADALQNGLPVSRKQR